ncbi:hypothetical protein DPMN_021853 [Dreissena polymorpha]|uniref:Uncharacterized protein n=1 Tax=Dreissena polymorpha TaxID=45954 RepID=A0A9D4SBD4_DREPO|nr:hypothetical protein DPMN_021853 [Dreissena polymorpha]
MCLKCHPTLACADCKVNDNPDPVWAQIQQLISDIQFVLRQPTCSKPLINISQYGYINASNSRAGHRHIVPKEALELKRSDPTESRLCVARLLM